MSELLGTKVITKIHMRNIMRVYLTNPSTISKTEETSSIPQITLYSILIQILTKDHDLDFSILD